MDSNARRRHEGRRQHGNDSARSQSPIGLALRAAAASSQAGVPAFQQPAPLDASAGMPPPRLPAPLSSRPPPPPSRSLSDDVAPAPSPAAAAPVAAAAEEGAVASTAPPRAARPVPSPAPARWSDAVEEEGEVQSAFGAAFTPLEAIPSRLPGGHSAPPPVCAVALLERSLRRPTKEGEFHSTVEDRVRDFLAKEFAGTPREECDPSRLFISSSFTRLELYRSQRFFVLVTLVPRQQPFPPVHAERCVVALLEKYGRNAPSPLEFEVDKVPYAYRACPTSEVEAMMHSYLSRSRASPSERLGEGLSCTLELRMPFPGVETLDYYRETVIPKLLVAPDGPPVVLNGFEQYAKQGERYCGALPPLCSPPFFPCPLP